MKTDEISEIKKFTIHVNEKGSITQSCRVIFYAIAAFSFLLESQPLKRVSRLSISIYLFAVVDNLQLPFLSASLKGLKS